MQQEDKPLRKNTVLQLQDDYQRQHRSSARGARRYYHPRNDTLLYCLQTDTGHQRTRKALHEDDERHQQTVWKAHQRFKKTNRKRTGRHIHPAAKTTLHLHNGTCRRTNRHYHCTQDTHLPTVEDYAATVKDQELQMVLHHLSILRPLPYLSEAQDICSGERRTAKASARSGSIEERRTYYFG